MAANNPNLTRKTLVAARTEATTGTHNLTSTNLANDAKSGAMLIFDEINPISMDTTVVDIAPVRASLSKNKNLIGRRLYNLRPKTYLMGSPGLSTNAYIYGKTNSQPSSTAHEVTTASAHTGHAAATGTVGASNAPNRTADTATTGATVAPFFGTLLRACGLQQIIQASTSTVYRPRSSGFESASVNVYADKILHKSASVMGSFTMSGSAGEGVELQFDLRGTYALPETSTVPSVAYPKDTKKLVQALGTKGGWEIDAVSGDHSTGANARVHGFGGGRPIVRSFTFDAGVNVVERMDANSKFGLQGLFVTDRAPTLELVVEVENDLTSANSAVSNFDPMKDLASEDGDSVRHALKFMHGDDDSTTSSFDKVGFTFPTAQLVDVQYADDAGIRTYSLSYNITADTDDNDYGIVFGCRQLSDLEDSLWNTSNVSRDTGFIS